jgi:Ca2+-binding RTX toxin-like protein
MTGALYFDGGAGADTMTGGSGANDFLYGATSDSPNTANGFDIISNFNVATNTIDLTGLHGSNGLALMLNDAGSLTATSLAADSVGWQVSNGNTFVYVNTSTGSETLNGTTGLTDMKIELAGVTWVTGLTNVTELTNGNILHFTSY